ncbi:MAG: hypothetical protein HYS08_04840 [Chlamydiae bacterium]|nr:hypothetical protein [Chlamydiota bacterium]MBI3265784.1 hypothetical protein [Chlamydiota bacterium]
MKATLKMLSVILSGFMIYSGAWAREESVGSFKDSLKANPEIAKILPAIHLRAAIRDLGSYVYLSRQEAQILKDDFKDIVKQAVLNLTNPNLMPLTGDFSSVAGDLVAVPKVQALLLFDGENFSIQYVSTFSTLGVVENFKGSGTVLGSFEPGVIRSRLEGIASNSSEGSLTSAIRDLGESISSSSGGSGSGGSSSSRGSSGLGSNIGEGSSSSSGPLSSSDSSSSSSGIGSNAGSGSGGPSGSGPSLPSPKNKG